MGKSDPEYAISEIVETLRIIQELSTIKWLGKSLPRAIAFEADAKIGGAYYAIAYRVSKQLND